MSMRTGNARYSAARSGKQCARAQPVVGVGLASSTQTHSDPFMSPLWELRRASLPESRPPAGWVIGQHLPSGLHLARLVTS